MVLCVCTECVQSGHVYTVIHKLVYNKLFQVITSQLVRDNVMNIENQSIFSMACTPWEQSHYPTHLPQLQVSGSPYYLNKTLSYEYYTFTTHKHQQPLVQKHTQAQTGL